MAPSPGCERVLHEKHSRRKRVSCISCKRKVVQNSSVKNSFVFCSELFRPGSAPLWGLAPRPQATRPGRTLPQPRRYANALPPPTPDGRGERMPTRWRRATVSVVFCVCFILFYRLFLVCFVVLSVFLFFQVCVSFFVLCLLLVTVLVFVFCLFFSGVVRLACVF